MRSNCLFEAVKAKIKNWNNVTLHYLPAKVNHGHIHFYWIENNEMHHFTNPKGKQSVLFEGVYKTVDIRYLTGMILMRAKNAGLSPKKTLKLIKKLGCGKGYTLTDVIESFNEED